MGFEIIPYPWPWSTRIEVLAKAQKINPSIAGAHFMNRELFDYSAFLLST